jgi:hypothetical protein
MYGDGTGNDLTFDESIDALVSEDIDVKLDDDAILFFGTGTNITTADGDFTMNFTDGSPGILTIAAVANEDVVQFGDGTIATDVIFQNTTAAGADVQWDDSAGAWLFGVDNLGVDVYFYGATTLHWMLWDETNNVLSLDGAVNMLEFRGATSDGHETTLAVVEPTASNVITLPDVDIGTIELGTVATTVITADTTATITVVPGTDGLFTYTIDTDDEDCTLTFSAGGTAGDIVTIIFDAGAASGQDEIMTFHTTLANVEGTLTLANVANGRYIIVFISDGTVWNEISRTAVLS